METDMDVTYGRGVDHRYWIAIVLVVGFVIATISAISKESGDQTPETPILQAPVNIETENGVSL